jgi:NitT/TauT family transport system ATP-binding protein
MMSARNNPAGAAGNPDTGRDGADGHSVVLHGVSKEFDNGVLALTEVDLQLRKGEVVSIVGPSGCGKSTMLRLIAGLLPPTAGDVTVHGTKVAGPRRDVGFMFQKPTLLPWKTSLENVVLAPRFAGVNRAKISREGQDLLRMVGLAGFEHAYPAQLSGGMQQRVALARLLIMGVDVLLLDEPFAAVDELTRERLNLELLQIHARIEASIVLVTHNIAEAVFLADRVMVMSPRPGRHAATFEVDLPRPRTLEHYASPAFAETSLKVRTLLEGMDHDADVIRRKAK